MSTPDFLKFAFKRRLDQILEAPGRPKSTSLLEILGLLPMILRLRSYVDNERKAGRIPYMDPLEQLDPGPYGGAPLGGLGGGSIMRGWQGDFGRWQIEEPGITHYRPVAADQFTVAVQRGGEKPHLQVLYPGRPEGGGLTGWAWDLPGKKSTYYALYPRAWTVYEDVAPKITLTCKQVSPIIPHNYKESSTPASAFVWTVENKGKDAATVSIMFTFQNGTGGESDRAGGHSNHLFREKTKSGEVIGVELRHAGDDPLSFGIAALASKEVEVTYRSRFVTTSSGMDVWGDLRDNAHLQNVEEEKPSSAGMAIGAAVCATVEVPAGATREIVFSLVWDAPLARFGGGSAYYRRYTRFYGREGKAVPALARDTLINVGDWEKEIDKWQKPILNQTGTPDWYKMALFNELYVLADGGTIWTDGAEGKKPPKADDIGHFGYLESHEYLMVNTYDVHFYASFALAMLWPELELSLQRDFAAAIQIEHPETITFLGTGRKGPRKLKGAIPHDLGSPVDDPWNRVNAYNFQDVSHWKDLNSKFVLQVYRDFSLTHDKKFAAEMWQPVVDALEHLMQYDEDEDGLIENGGFPDQTYDVWTASDASAYSGGLWLAALSAAAALGDALGKDKEARRYRGLLKRGQAAYENLLWTGDYYMYDASRSRHHDSVMADQLAGQWYAAACGLPSIVPSVHARSALKLVYDLNVMRFEEGTLGAVNGMRPDGTVDRSCLQSQEVWPGTTFAVAAAMLQEDLDQEAWATAKGAVDVIYKECGYWFHTPEAWDASGNQRSVGYMRPLAIWAIQWAWERVGKKGK
jgi:non-lysosomal glucosylceramidase